MLVASAERSQGQGLGGYATETTQPTLVDHGRSIDPGDDPIVHQFQSHRGPLHKSALEKGMEQLCLPSQRTSTNNVTFNVLKF